jgi:hypothetical protein
VLPRTHRQADGHGCDEEAWSLSSQCNLTGTNRERRRSKLATQLIWSVGLTEVVGGEVRIAMPQDAAAPVTCDV